MKVKVLTSGRCAARLKKPDTRGKARFGKCSNLQSNLTSIQTKFCNERFNEACRGEN